MVHRISRSQALRVAIFSKCPLSTILFLMNSSQKEIRSSEIPREPPRQIWMQSNQCFTRYRFLSSHFFKISSVSHLALNNFFPKVYQIIWNNQRTTTLNLNAIQPTVHMIMRPQAFWVDIFSKCPPSAILFLLNSSQKVIRLSEIPREQPIKFKWNPFKG